VKPCAGNVGTQITVRIAKVVLIVVSVMMIMMMMMVTAMQTCCTRIWTRS